MPHNKLQDLPESVGSHLPKQAFNHAREEYETEERGFKVAWSAFKQ